MRNKILAGVAAAALLYAVKIRIWDWLPIAFAAIPEFGFVIAGLFALVVVFLVVVGILDAKLPLATALVLAFLAAPGQVTEAAPRPTPTSRPYQDRYGFSPSGRIAAINIDYEKAGSNSSFVDRQTRAYDPLWCQRDDWMMGHSNLVFPDFGL